MNVISATHKDLLTPNSARNRMMMSRQIRCVVELYKQFPDILVGGGMPYNAGFRIGARDIDIFCISNETALAVKEYLRGDATSAALGVVPQYFSFDNETGTHYNPVFNSDVHKFLGSPREQRGVAFDFNVIVRRVPPETVFLNRLQLIPLYELTVPYSPYGICYAETDLGLQVFRPKSSSASAVFDTTADGSVYNKVIKKHLMISLAFRYQSVRTFGPALSSYFFSTPPNKENTPYVPSGDHTRFLFNHSKYLIRQLFGTSFSVNTTSGLFKHEIDISARYEQPDDIAFNNRLTHVEKHQAFEAIAIKAVPHFTKQHTDKTHFLYMSTLRSAYFSNIGISLRSRSQDWFDTWGLTQTVQPSGRENPELSAATPAEFTVGPPSPPRFSTNSTRATLVQSRELQSRLEAYLASASAVSGPATATITSSEIRAAYQGFNTRTGDHSTAA